MLGLKLIEYRRIINYIILKNSWTTVVYTLFLVALPTMILMNSCASSNHVRDWTTSKDYDRNFEKVLIMGLVNKVSLRIDIEYAMVDAAQKIGLKSNNSMAMFPPELGKPLDDIEQIKDRLKEAGFNGILTVALIDVSAERYVPPEKAYAPLAYYDRFKDYYYRTEALVYKPGYVSLQTRYFLETNLYELKAGTLVWSGRSYAFDPQKLETTVPSYAKKLFKELLKEGVISY